MFEEAMVRNILGRRGVERQNVEERCGSKPSCLVSVPCLMQAEVYHSLGRSKDSRRDA